MVGWGIDGGNGKRIKLKLYWCYVAFNGTLEELKTLSIYFSIIIFVQVKRKENPPLPTKTSSSYVYLFTAKPYAYPFLSFDPYFLFSTNSLYIYQILLSLSLFLSHCYIFTISFFLNVIS